MSKKPINTSTNIEESKGKENRWKCGNCSQIFTDKQSELEGDDRCPLCKFPFSQMPYNQPHGIADKILVKDSAPPLSKTGAAMRLVEEARRRHEMEYQIAKALITGKLDSQVIRWAEMIVDIYEKEINL